MPAAEKTRFDITGIIKGVRRDGEVILNGWIGPGARDSSSLSCIDYGQVAGIDIWLKTL